MSKKTVLSLAALMLAACASKPVPSVADVSDATEPLICDGPVQCQTAWRLAQLWVVTNSGLKIQLATDVVIQTYPGDQTTTLRNYTITRQPIEGQRERITFASACQSIFGCRGNEVQLAASFKRYVREGMLAGRQS